MPAPIASYGNNANIGGGIREHLLPEYEIVHGSTDFAAALAELPALAAGDLSIKPSSGLGTNATGTPQVPKAILVSGAAPEEEFAQLQALITNIPIVRVTREDVAAAGGTGPDPALIAKLLKEKLKAVGVVA